MNRRNLQIDDARGWGIILMLLGHAMNFSVGSSNLLWSFIYCFHMPLFFVISGINSELGNGLMRIKHISKKLLLPYTIVGVTLCLIYMLSGHGLIGFLSFILCKTGRPMLSYDWQPAIGPIWFIPCFLMSHILCEAINTVPIKMGKYGLLILLFECSLVFANRWNMLPWLILQSTVGAIFIMLGNEMKTEKFRTIVSNKYLIFIELLLFVICFLKGSLIMTSHVYKLNLLQLLGAFCGCILLLQFVKFIPNVTIEKTGRYSLYILCIHTIDYNLGFSTKLANCFAINSSLVNCMLIFLCEMFFVLIGLFFVWRIKLLFDK